MTTPAAPAPTLADAKAYVVARHNLRPEVTSWSASRIMSAIGHPGYGRTFSERAITVMAETGRCAHDVVYAALA